jgi:lipopolysaccharide export system permease protein
MMKLSLTLNRYLGRTYLLNLLFMIVGLLSIIYLFDTVELLRRAAKKDNVPLSLILQMGLFKLPEVGQMILPFAVLFSAMFTFWNLTRRYELIVVRSAGFSVWQFLAPVLGLGILLGIIQMGMINPLGAMLVTHYERLENTHLNSGKNTITHFKDGFWLRQIEEDQSYAILHSEKIDLANWVLRDVMVLFYDADHHFVRRLDSEQASLEEGLWKFENVKMNEDNKTRDIPLVALPTSLTASEIEDSFSSPKTMSFWNLPGFINNMEDTGFDATRLRIYFHSLLSQPLMFVAMILLAACVSLRPPRMRGTLTMVVAGIFIGFIVFFMSSFLQALGASKQIPVVLAAWSPAVIATLCGVAVIFSLEDG